MATSSIVVVGSISTEVLVRCGEWPAPGALVMGSDLEWSAGGKGANQAVAAARLLGARAGGGVHLVGRVGADDAGSKLLGQLEGEGVSTTFVTVTEGVATGGSIHVTSPGGMGSGGSGGSAGSGAAGVGDGGQAGGGVSGGGVSGGGVSGGGVSGGVVTTILSGGANARMTPADVERALPILRTASVVLVQLELPGETVAHTIRLCHRHRIAVVVDPSPLRMSAAREVGKHLAAEVLSATIVTPDLEEALELTGLPAGTEPRKVAETLRAKGPGAVVLKMGEAGSMYCGVDGAGIVGGLGGGAGTAGAGGGSAGDMVLHVPAFKVKAKDFTAAGDAFTAALAVARAEGKPAAEALRFANAAGAVTRMERGSQSTLPTRTQVEDMLRRWN